MNASSSREDGGGTTGKPGLFKASETQTTNNAPVSAAVHNCLESRNRAF